MTYISLSYYILIAITLVVYYLLPMKARWLSLFAGSIAFYFLAYSDGWWIVLLTALITFVAANLLEKYKERKRVSKAILICAVTVIAVPWFLTKNFTVLWSYVDHSESLEWIVPMGISFYTLQLIAYMVDVHQEKISAEKNPLKFILFTIYFPQILQGPIPRYKQLSNQLYNGNSFSEEKFMRGAISIAWGFFLKLMIADKAAVVVNPIFENYRQYRGMFVVVAGILYSFQLYADFSACMSISKGVSLLFGISLEENFRQPYFASSVKDFWRRWHITLSSWLRDYIYIPLGGNRKGRVRKYVNLMITFLVSGIWHGAGMNFIVWGGGTRSLSDLW